MERTEAFIRQGAAATAILAAADILAVGAMKALFESGLRVPEDVSVMGFDDLEFSRYLSPGLTTIRQQIAEKGKRAVELLVRNIREPELTKREEIIPVSLVVRGSVKNLKGEG
jgi:LacI family transcriptional regulator